MSAESIQPLKSFSSVGITYPPRASPRQNRTELADVYSRLKRAEAPVLEEGATTCCYVKSEKSWVEDPQGVQWETFLTTGESTIYGTDPVRESRKPCCVPLPREEERT